MTQLTTLNEIEQHIILLGKVEVANALFVSWDVNLGVTTVNAWTDRPKLRGRVRKDWRQPRCPVQRAHCFKRLLEEKLAGLERQMYASRHTHPTMADNPKIAVWGDD